MTEFSHLSVPQLLGTPAFHAHLDQISGSDIRLDELIIKIRNAETAKRILVERWTRENYD